MSFSFTFSNEARETMEHLTLYNPKKLRKVQKALAYLQVNPHHHSLQTHKFTSLKGPNKEDIFEAYVENNVPGAWRIFFHYGPGPETIRIALITPHPD